MNDVFIEQQILEAVKKMLTGLVNDLLGKVQYAIPIVEIGNYAGSSVVNPTITLFSCERSEKERIIKIDAYSLTITFNVPETPDSELYCYVYAWVVCRAMEQNPTLGGVVDRAVLTGKKYIKPKKAACGQDWEITLNFRLTVEGYNYAG